MRVTGSILFPGKPVGSFDVFYWLVWLGVWWFCKLVPYTPVNSYIYIYIAGWPGGFTSVGWRTEVFHPFETLWLPCDLGQLDNQQQPGWWFCRVYCGSWYYMLQLDAHPKAPPKRHWVPGETWAGSTPSCNSPTRCCPTPVQKFYVTPLLMGVFLHPNRKPSFFVGPIFFGLCVSSTFPMFNMEPPFPGVNFQVPY